MAFRIDQLARSWITLLAALVALHGGYRSASVESETSGAVKEIESVHHVVAPRSGGAVGGRRLEAWGPVGLRVNFSGQCHAQRCKSDPALRAFTSHNGCGSPLRC